MCKTELARFRKRLTNQLDEVTSNIKKHGSPGAEAADETSCLLVCREERLAKKIVSALQRLGDGTFGDCTGCGIKISMRRLQANPCVSLCLDCQRQKESGMSESVARQIA